MATAALHLLLGDDLVLALKKILSGAAMAVVFAVGALMLLSLVGAAFETMADWQIEHKRCLKRATNGYDIARCR